MTTIEYDLDTSGGLMPQIQALIAPPSSDVSKYRRRKKPSSSSSHCNANVQSVFVRQPKAGKIPNHEYCDSCREGGDLLCCDRCPAAFHFQCHEPPLDEDDVPIGEWICRRCKVIEQREKLESADDTPPVCDGRIVVNDSSHNDKSQLTVNNCNDDVQLNDSDEEMETIGKPLDTLIKAAQMMNPKQFQLPNELTPSIQLIGTSKKILPNSSKGQKRAPHELDNGLVPLPVKTCFQCGISCRKAPLIQCDYCPLLFHCDCLDPPLTVMPTGRWMCPNHSEHVLEQKLLNSVSLTEKIKLWDEFSSHLSHNAIKIDFLKNIHRKNPPYRCKIPLPSMGRVRVPNAIKEMYKNPPQLLPKINAQIYNHNIIMPKTVIKREDDVSELMRPTDEEQEEWLRNVIALQLSIAQHLSFKHKTVDSSESPSNTSQSANRKAFNTSSPSKIQNEKGNKYNNVQHSMNGPLNHMRKDNGISDSKSFDCDVKIKPEKLESDIYMKLNGNKSPSFSDKRHPPSQFSLNNNTHFEEYSDVELLNKLDESLLRTLALQRIQQLMTPSKSINADSASNTPSITSYNSSSITSPQTTVKRICLGDVKARAVLCPVFIRSSNGSLNTNSSGPAIAMSYRTLTIGTGADNDVVLGNYGFCNYVSNRHACIFFDETSKHYELINYSEHGTTVDNVLYSCDFSDKKIHSPNYIHNDSHIVTAVKEIIKKGRKPKHETIQKRKALMSDKMSQNGSEKKRKTSKGGDGNAQIKPNNSSYKKDIQETSNVERISVQVQAHNVATMNAKSGQTWKQCACKSSCSTLIGGNGAGWEGTAILHHGSYIKIGCNQFVFSITNYGIPQIITSNSPIKSNTKHHSINAGGTK